ncbi:MAG: enoyl-CoA hydratase/isomerase family protein [Pseudomonadota bacterium]
MADIKFSRSGDLVTLTLSNPGKLNAMSYDMWLAFAKHWKALNADDSVRCIVVTGDAPRGFCPGNDISEFDTYRSSAAKARDLSAVMNDGRTAMLACPHPIIAKINGPCVGGGLEIAAMCDMRIASDVSRFGAPLNRIGLTMAYEEMIPIWRLTDEATLFEMLVEGTVFDAAEAKTRGLVNRIAPESSLDEKVSACCQKILDGPPLVNRWHKQFFKRLRREPELTQSDHDVHYEAFETEDYKIGYRSFLAKTKPEFIGR